ncbi:MAG: hypothetical protein ABI684_14590 [Nitrospirota bacterium]
MTREEGKGPDESGPAMPSLENVLAYYKWYDQASGSALPENYPRF